MNKNDLILITGANGFVATEIIKQLLEAGHKVRGTVRKVEDEEKYAHLKNFKNADTNLEIVSADLLKEESLIEAVKDCVYVLHVASPFPKINPNDADILIKPALNGTLNVLKACAESSKVKRVVLTSSTVAVYDASSTLPKDKEDKKVFNEEDWTNIDSPIDVYAKSKVVAEKAAWDFVEKLSDNQKFEFAVINPGLVIGPIYSSNVPTSINFIQRLLNGSMFVVAKLCIPLADNRDVALAHIKALTEPEAVGNRHIIITECLSQKDFALYLQKEFRPQGYFVPTMVAPNFAVYLASWWDKGIKLISSRLGKTYKFENRRMVEVLKVTPTPSEKILIDSAYSLIEMGLIPKPKKKKCSS